MPFRIVGLDPAAFRHLYDRLDADLSQFGAQRVTADSCPGFPDRIELRDAEPGETLLLLNYTHQPANNPYRACHAIFVREGAERRYDRVGEIPEVMRIRPISLRAFNDADEMVQAELVDGVSLALQIERMFAEAGIAYLHAHYAKRGCFAARVERAVECTSHSASMIASG